MRPEPSRADGADIPEAGVPLGGVGAGCIEMGADGRLRNVTINNNRLASERIPWADSSFLAVRAAHADDAHVRVLQNTSSIDFESAPPLLLPADTLSISSYRIRPQVPTNLPFFGSFVCPAFAFGDCTGPIWPKSVFSGRGRVAFVDVLRRATSSNSYGPPGEIGSAYLTIVGTPVPEPSSLILLIVGAAGIWRRGVSTSRSTGEVLE